MIKTIAGDFYVSDDIPVRFDVEVDGEKVKPISVTAESYGPNRKFLEQKLITPTSPEVIYLLDKKFVTGPGGYGFVFTCRLRKYGNHTESMKLTVKNRPFCKKGK